jgi:hypothetical protein
MGLRWRLKRPEPIEAQERLSTGMVKQALLAQTPKAIKSRWGERLSRR